MNRTDEDFSIASVDGSETKEAYKHVASFLKGRDFPGTVCMSSSNLASSKPGIETHGTVKPRHSDPGAEVVLQVEDENSYDASTRQRTNPLGYIVPTSFPPSDTSDKVVHANLNSTRDNRFVKILEAPSVNLKELEKLVWNGCPQVHRPLCWKLLLGYLPPSADRREAVLDRKRKEYHSWVQQHYEMDRIDMSDDELAVLHQIKIDIPRTVAKVDLFKIPEIQRSLERILYIRAVRNPGTSYVQGMNDLVTPFISVFLSELFDGDASLCNLEGLSACKLFDVEADCYWCLCKVLDSIQDHYTFAQPGIQKICFRIGEVVRRIDDEVDKHLSREGTEYLHFAFRWVNCLLLRELPFSLSPRLWDTYLAEGDSKANFLVYICAALLLNWSDELKQLEFQELILFLQHLPTDGWDYSELELIISQAHLWRHQYPLNN